MVRRVIKMTGEQGAGYMSRIGDERLRDGVFGLNELFDDQFRYPDYTCLIQPR